MKNRKNLSIRTNRCRVPPVTDYTCYIPTKRESAGYFFLGLLFAAFVSWQFYDSIIAWFFMIPLVGLSLRNRCSTLCRRRKRRLELEFKEVILSVSANLQVGYSAENAFDEAYKDIVVLYGKESVMASELCLILRRISYNEPLEEALFDLAERSGIQDIRDFADVFRIAKRSGGDMRGIIANTSEILNGKQEVRREIETVISEKKMEQTIMRVMPFFIICYTAFTTKGYFESLYHNITGYVIMTVALLIYGAACKLADHILDIDI